MKAASKTPPRPKYLVVASAAEKEKKRARRSGPVGKAKILTKEQFEKAAQVAEQSLYPSRDRLFILLSRYGALRAKEIANIHVEDFTDATGKPIPELHISKRGAKYGKERTIDIPEVLVQALDDYRKEAEIEKGPLFYTYRGEKASSNTVQKQIKAIYERAGFHGARSHSGRRSAITTLAQTINLDGGSLKDVQIFAGHADLSTTAGYIEKSPYGKKMAARL